ncbi:MAG: glycoside hydrolase family 9 protein [Spirochaetes bacterium]|nr:glycoside hydrolase family 9 protein [Spirochaetota bacterium]
MKKQFKSFLFILIAALTLVLFVSCGDTSEKKDQEKKVNNPVPEKPVLEIRRSELLRNTDFETNYAPWVVAEDKKGEIIGELKEYIDDNSNQSLAMVGTVTNQGVENWSVQIRHGGLTLEEGHTYTVKFSIMATENIDVCPQLVIPEPWALFWQVNEDWSPVSLTANKWETKTDSFIMSSSTQENVELAFHFGGDYANSNSNFEVWIDNVSITDPEFEGYEDDESEAALIRVNQVGYFPRNVKKATAVTNSTSPLEWQLINSEETVVASGFTTVFGYDADSGDNVHTIDFSSYMNVGTYRLRMNLVGSEPSISHEFEITNDLYSQMKYDALAYFYHNRSGIAIELPYAGREDLERTAGPADTSISTWPGTGQASYSKDVSKGWYDAGDHGKYVVNGGIAVWTIMNQYERTLYIDNAAGADFSDGSMNIPDDKDGMTNGIPDILDEAQWEMEFLLNMQVKESEDSATAGMVHHKMHDSAWTGIPLAPGDNTSTRYLCPVSTAATLNLAATAAQAARLFREYDAAFADRCLAAAEAAWNAALADPENYAPYDNENGGGPYDDTYVIDEFYWAAAELFITTGEDSYYDYMSSSPHFLELRCNLLNGEDAGLFGPFSWQNVAGLGTVSLSIASNNLSSSEKETIKRNIYYAADVWLKNIKMQGYDLPLWTNMTNKYPWGSNSFILNMMVVMGYAYDYSSNIKYLNGMIQSMDYLLGRNAMDKSYVTGYGDRPLLNPHHRFWAKQAASAYPSPPAGAISGGPNSGYQCPVAQSIFDENTPPQKAFVDNIEAWSTNEITVNWNAPFAWVAAYLDEKKNNVTIDIASIGPKHLWMTGTGIVSPKFAEVLPLRVKASAGNSGVTLQRIEFWYDGQNSDSQSVSDRAMTYTVSSSDRSGFDKQIDVPRPDGSIFDVYKTLKVRAKMFCSDGTVKELEYGLFNFQKSFSRGSDLTGIESSYTNDGINSYVEGQEVSVGVIVGTTYAYERCGGAFLYAIPKDADYNSTSSWTCVGSVNTSTDVPVETTDEGYRIYTISWVPQAGVEYIYVLRSDWYHRYISNGYTRYSIYPEDDSYIIYE